MIPLEVFQDGDNDRDDRLRNEASFRVDLG
jgi:hypothetical protein